MNKKNDDLSCNRPIATKFHSLSRQKKLNVVSIFGDQHIIIYLHCL